MNKYQLLIGGEWVDPTGNEWLESMNPFTAAPWALVPRARKPDVDRAVAAAKRAFYSDAWRGLSATDRGASYRIASIPQLYVRRRAARRGER